MNAQEHDRDQRQTQAQGLEGQPSAPPGLAVEQRKELESLGYVETGEEGSASIAPVETPSSEDKLHANRSDLVGEMKQEEAFGKKDAAAAGGAASEAACLLRR